MDIRDRRALTQYTAQKLDSAVYPPRHLVLLHTGVALGVSLLLTLVNFYLARQIDQTGGLAGLGIRSVLSTVQSLLQIAGSLALTFWEFGILFAALRLARGQAAEPGCLCEGFRRFWPMLRLQLLRALLVVGLVILCGYAGAILFALSPFSDPMQQVLAPLLTDSAMFDPTTTLDEATMLALLPTLTPLFVIIGILLCVVGLPLFYRFRMAEYALLDSDKVGAIAAIRISSQLMRGRRLSLLKLDLYFWWFYLLQTLTLLISYADLILALLQIPLPFSADAAFFLFYGLHIFCQLALHWWARAKVETTYAAAFDTLRQPPAAIPKPAPKNLPWSY